MKRKLFFLMTMVVLTTFIFGCQLLLTANVKTNVKVPVPLPKAQLSQQKAEPKPAEKLQPQASKPEAPKEDEPLLVVHEGSNVIYDDKVGLEEFSFVLNDSMVISLEGRIRRLFYRAPDGSSPLEIIRFYENHIRNEGGEILFKTRDPQPIIVKDDKLTSYFKKHRIGRSMSTYEATYTTFPNGMTEYISGKMKNKKTEFYFIVASGKGFWAAGTQENTYFEIVTVKL